MKVGTRSYVERLNLYFDVNDIIENKRLPAFLSIIGSNTYGVLKSLVSPTPPGEHTFNKIATQGAPQMAVDKEANSLSRVYSYYSKFNLRLFYV